MSGNAFAPPEPGGFLAEHQRAHCRGESATTTFQGLRWDEIIVNESAAGQPEAFVAAVDRFVEFALNETLLLPGEFAPEAMFSYCAHDYVAQALAGGHAQYWANRSHDPLSLRCAGQGLKSMLADPYFDVFTTMTSLHQGDKRGLKKLLKQRRWRDAGAGLAALDQALRALAAAEPLAPRQRAWLLSLRKTRIVADEDMPTYWHAIGVSNPLARERGMERDRARAERDKNDPNYSNVRALCDMAGLRLLALGDGARAPMHAHWPEGPDVSAFVRVVHTDQGERTALFYREGGLFKRYLAVLVEAGSALPLGSLTLSRAEFDAVVPSYARR